MPSKAPFEPNEPIRVIAKFSVSEGIVCFNEPRVYALDIELLEVESNEKREQTSIVMCGTPYLLLTPFIPVFYAGAILDVADVGGHHVTISEGKNREFAYTLMGANKGFILFDDKGPELNNWEHDPLSPGKYRLSMKFLSDLSPIYPDPLFWSMYDQPVTASTEFEVKAAGR